MVSVIRVLGVFVALLMIVFASPESHAESIEAENPAFDVATAIGSASTKTDHEKIALYFEREAKDLGMKVALHQRMKKTYQRGGHMRGFNARMRAHCERLIKLYKAAARENHEMSTSHQHMAEGALQ